MQDTPQIQGHASPFKTHRVIACIAWTHDQDRPTKASENEWKSSSIASNVSYDSYVFLCPLTFDHKSKHV